MIKRLCTLAAVLGLVFAMPVVAAAQFSLAAGKAFTIGDFADDAENGWAMQATYGFELPNVPIGLRADVLYNNFTNVEREPSLYARVGGEWFRQLGFVLNAQRSLPLGAIQPYGLLGVGVIREWHGDYSHSGTDQFNLRLNAGVGVEVPLWGDGGGLFIETRQIFLGKALPLTRPAVHPDTNFQSVPVLIGFRL